MEELRNIYLFQVINSYPYDLPEAIEALTYALSFDDENVVALSLMARICDEQLGDKKRAVEYYQKALEVDVYAVQIYPSYIDALIKLSEYSAAEKTIDFALGLPGSDLGHLYVLKMLLEEHQGMYESALVSLKLSKSNAYNGNLIAYLKNSEERINEKMGKTKPKKDKSGKKGKKGK